MSCPAVKLIVRYMRVAPVLSFMFAGCTCSDGSEGTPVAPAAPAEVTRPQAAAAPTEAPTEAPQPPAASPPQPSPTVEAARAVPSDAQRAACKNYVAALSGEKRDPALLKNPEVVALAPRVTDLLTCVAVKGDSAAACDALIPTLPSGERRYSNEARGCLYTQSIFHEARAYPKGTSFTFSDIELQQCDDRKACDALREATRTGDVEKCAALESFQSICRAFVKLDKSLCRVEGKLPERKGPGGSYVASAVEEGCREIIDSRAFLARGLQTVAESGSGKEQALARAALGQTDACKQFEEAAVDTCLANVAPETAAGATPAAPSATAPIPPAKTPPEERASGSAPA